MSREPHALTGVNALFWEIDESSETGGRSRLDRFRAGFTQPEAIGM